jgi:hypothetical protein
MRALAGRWSRSCEGETLPGYTARARVFEAAVNMSAAYSIYSAGAHAEWHAVIAGFRQEPLPGDGTILAAAGHALGTRLRPDPQPRQQPACGPADRPGLGLNPDYALTTDLDDPVIIASITAAGSGPPAPLLIDGYALPVIVRCHRGHATYQLSGGRDGLPRTRWRRRSRRDGPRARGARPCRSG